MTLIPFPLAARANLVRSMVNDLHRVHGQAANTFWRDRVAGIVAELREAGHTPETIRQEIFDLQHAVQRELQSAAGGKKDATG